MADLLAISANVNNETIRQLINSYPIPPYPKNNTSILHNLNLSNISSDIRYGITTNKTLMRSLPTNKVFTKSPDDIYDRLKLTAIPINTSILILHQSTDHKYLFVMADFYYGWILKKDVYICNIAEFTRNLTKSSPLIITDAFFTYRDLIFDMGTKLNYKINNNQVYAQVYTKQGIQGIPLPNSAYSLKPLKLTWKNITKQASKYLNIPYSLGDDYLAIDCSSMVRNVLSCFNYLIPRDTKDIINYLDINHSINEPGIKLLHFPGHIAIYLKYKYHKHYYIHASASYHKVVISYLDPSYLSENDLIGVSIIK